VENASTIQKQNLKKLKQPLDPMTQMSPLQPSVATLGYANTVTF